MKRRQTLASIQTVSKNKYRKKSNENKWKRQNGFLLECVYDSMKSLLSQRKIGNRINTRILNIGLNSYF